MKFSAKYPKKINSLIIVLVKGMKVFHIPLNFFWRCDRIRHIYFPPSESLCMIFIFYASLENKAGLPAT
jgi:hypothetical protein